MWHHKKLSPVESLWKNGSRIQYSPALVGSSIFMHKIQLPEQGRFKCSGSVAMCVCIAGHTSPPPPPYCTTPERATQVVVIF
eukprot:m.364245 g.364245  ORF g.364245 m.364245 type:complete len:82 (-) comp26100_c0_seq1:771-1016(-)